MVDGRISHTELVAKAASANMDMLKADLAQDALGLQSYQDAVARAKSEWDRRVCRYKRQRYENGCYNVAQFMKNRFAIVDIPVPLHISREVGEMRRYLEQEVRTKGEGSALVMLYLDLNIDHSPAALATLLEATKLLHHTPIFCICLRWVVRHANNTTEAVTMVNRKVEDAMYKAGISLCDTPATLLFEAVGLHKSDQRPLAARFSVGVEAIWCR